MIDIPDSVFPLNSEGAPLCPKCRKTLQDCACPSLEPPKPRKEPFKAHVRLEKKGRQGKSVTVVFGLPRSEDFLRDLSKTLKIKTGSGGTYYQDTDGGVIEIQGDHQKTVLNLLNPGD
jgi:translation initiation factor 1